jgi:hypothetical protein
MTRHTAAQRGDQPTDTTAAHQLTADVRERVFLLRERLRRLRRDGQLVIDDDGGLTLLRELDLPTTTVKRSPRRRPDDGALRYEAYCPGKCGSYWFRPVPGSGDPRDRCQKCWAEHLRSLQEQPIPEQVRGGPRTEPSRSGRAAATS